MADRLAFVWDFDIDAAQFQALLASELEIGRLNRDWAAIQLLGFAALVQGWPAWRHRIRSATRQRGCDFLVAWLPQHHPELL